MWFQVGQGCSGKEVSPVQRAALQSKSDDHSLPKIGQTAKLAFAKQK
ncbi:hypothetical protein [Anaerotignum neopropionicum]|nr:hypothetical protein [Anaerotignum neopropionicum]